MEATKIVAAAVAKPKAKGKPLKKKKCGVKDLLMLDEAKKRLPPLARMSLESEWHTRLKVEYPSELPPHHFGTCFDDSSDNSKIIAVRACLWWAWNEHLAMFPDEQCPYDFS